MQTSRTINCMCVPDIWDGNFFFKKSSKIVYIIPKKEAGKLQCCMDDGYKVRKYLSVVIKRKHITSALI